MSKIHRRNCIKAKTGDTRCDKLLLQVLDVTYSYTMVSAKHAFIEMGKVGERPLQAGGYKMAKDEVQRKARLIPALETGASVMQEHYICDCKKTGGAV